MIKPENGSEMGEKRRGKEHGETLNWGNKQERLLVKNGSLYYHL